MIRFELRWGLLGSSVSNPFKWLKKNKTNGKDDLIPHKIKRNMDKHLNMIKFKTPTRVSPFRSCDL